MVHRLSYFQEPTLELVHWEVLLVSAIALEGKEKKSIRRGRRIGGIRNIRLIENLSVACGPTHSSVTPLDLVYISFSATRLFLGFGPLTEVMSSTCR